MKRTPMALMLVAATATVVVLFASEASTHAQSTEPQFKLGDRIEAMFASNSGGVYKQEWRQATITRLFEAKNGRKDPVIVALADAITSRGSDDKLEASRVRELHIPYSKIEDLAVRRMAVAKTLPSGHVLIKGITVIITDKRYVLYTRTLGGSIYADAEAVAVDETGSIVGLRTWGESPSRDLSDVLAESVATDDRVNWANSLIPGKVRAVGLWQEKP